MDAVIFATHLIEYAFVGVSLLIGKFIGEVCLNVSHNALYKDLSVNMLGYSTL